MSAQDVRNRGVSEDDVVSDNVGLGAGAPLFAAEVAKHGAAARRVDPAVVTLHRHRVWLVEGDPTLHPVPKRLETRLRVRRVVVAALAVCMFGLLDHHCS